MNNSESQASPLATEAAESAEILDWCVYIIEACDSRLYTGITNDITRRWQAHSSGKGGAKFFRGRKPKTLCYLECDHNRSSASRREAAIKKLSRHNKEKLIASQSKAARTKLQMLMQDTASA